MKFSALVPMLQTQDMPRTREWYESVLGFTASKDSNADWCWLSRDGVALMFMCNAQLGAPRATATQYFYVDDVLALWSAIKDRCPIEWGPAEMEYGMLEFAVKDPNGYYLSFGQPLARPARRTP
jgi:catechol 2,3-dioxygenase-like lactoylglutathione lyase family enzyme